MIIDNLIVDDLIPDEPEPGETWVKAKADISVLCSITDEKWNKLVKDYQNNKAEA